MTTRPLEVMTSNPDLMPTGTPAFNPVSALSNVQDQQTRFRLGSQELASSLTERTRRLLSRFHEETSAPAANNSQARREEPLAGNMFVEDLPFFPEQTTLELQKGETHGCSGCSTVVRTPLSRG